MTGAASCSSSAAAAAAAPSSKKLYDVFISFRGEDTRRNFTAHLHAALCRNQIRTFKDNINLEKGDEAWPALVQAIDNSHLCIVVFSKHYASSTWCLRELAHILESKKERQVIIPVFYQIDPSHIRHQSESYKDAFDKHEKNLKLDAEVINKWKATLEKAANFSGFDSKNSEDDNQFIETIVKDIWKKLQQIYPRSHPKGLVGIDKILKNVEPLFKEAQTIGLWGMGGIGKTTTARVLFNRDSDQYEGHCFLEDVRESSRRLGLPSLRQKFICKLLFPAETHCIDPDSEMTKRTLESRRVFIVLDDVDNSQQIEFLVDDFNRFGPNSKIIITTRDKHVLNGRVDIIHEVEGLDYEESVQLFQLNAFHQEHPQAGFEELSEKVVNYGKGLPLALKVLGSIFSGKSQEMWKSEFERLEKYPDERIHNVLRWSYDGLNHEEKEIFLDIAFFFKGKREEDVEHFLNSCNFFAIIGLNALKNKALVTSVGGRLAMHDRIQEMAWQIVGEKDLERRSRLKNLVDIHHMLKNNKGSDVIEGIIFELFQMPDDNAFKKMTKLRFLKFCCPSTSTFKMIIDVFDGIRFCQVQVESLYDLDDKLNDSHWMTEMEYHRMFPELIDHFEALKLGESNDSNWMTVMEYHRKFPKLIDYFEDKPNDSIGLMEGEYYNRWRRMEYNSKFLGRKEYYSKFPELIRLSEALKIELINISNNRRLLHVPAMYCAENFVRFIMHDEFIEKLWDGVQNLVSLKEINLGGCCKLVELPDLSKALNLESIDLSYCLSLRHVPTNFCVEKLVRFVMRGGPFKKLWDKTQNLVSLEKIDLAESRELTEVPDLSKASKLREVELSDCDNLYRFRPSLSLQSLNSSNLSGRKSLKSLLLPLRSLHKRNLSGCNNLESLKSGIHLDDLSFLNLRGCSRLTEFSLSSAKLEKLDLRDTAIETLDSSIGSCSNIQSLLLNNLRIKSLPNELSKLGSLRELNLSHLRELDTGNLHIILSGLTSLRHLNLQETNVKRLPSCIDSFPLEDICLSNCKRLRSIPGLPLSLTSLNANGCTSLEIINTKMVSADFRLRHLNLCEANVESLPACIKDLPFLENICISNCKRLGSILGLPPSLASLDANGCTSLDTINTPMTSTVLDVGTSFLWNGLWMCFKNCVRLDANTICAIEGHAHKIIMVAAAWQGDHSFQLCFPGIGVPSWFGYHEMKSSITIECPPDFNPLGFAFSVVLANGTFSSYSVSIECTCYLEDSEIVTSSSRNYDWYNDVSWELIPSHVILWYHETDSEAIMKTIRESRAKRTSYNPKLLFQFSVQSQFDTRIKECGVWPVHASEIKYSAEEMKEWLELGSTMDRPTKRLKPSFPT